MKASLKGRYDTEKCGGATGTFAFNAGDVKLKASMTDATFSTGPSFNGLVLSVEKPGFFTVDYNVPKKVHPDFSEKSCLVDKRITIKEPKSN